MDISSDSSSSDEDTAIGAYFGLQCWFALHRTCGRKAILDLELFFLSIYDTL